MRAVICLALLSSCAAMTTPPVPRNRIDPWPDLAASIEAIRCAIERVDGAELAARVVGVPVIVFDRYHLRGCYDAEKDDANTDGCVGDTRPPAIYLNGSEARTAWSSPLRYELLCRRRLHLLEGSERRCTGQRFEQEIKPRYAEALHACRIRSAEAPALDLPGDAP